MQLIQRRLLKKISVTLHEHHLAYRTNELLTTLEFNIPYDSFFLMNKIRTRRLNPWLLFVTIIVSLGTISLLWGTISGKLEKSNLGFTIIYSTICILLILASIISNKPKIIVPVEQGAFQLYENNPNSETFNSFLSSLQEKQKTSLMNRFVYNNEYTYDARLNYLDILWKYGIIPENEFKKTKDEIEKEFFASNDQTKLN